MTNFIIRKAERVAPLVCGGKWSESVLLDPVVEGLQATSANTVCLGCSGQGFC